jgi:hypothetical protein
MYVVNKKRKREEAAKKCNGDISSRVLDQTRLRPHETSLFSMEILKPTAQLKNKQTRHDLAIKVRTTD